MGSKSKYVTRQINFKTLVDQRVLVISCKVLKHPSGFMKYTFLHHRAQYRDADECQEQIKKRTAYENQ